MDRIVDKECLLDQASLLPFNVGGNNTAVIKPLEVWRTLDLMTEKLRR